MEDIKSNLIERINIYGELKSSLGKAEQIKWKNQMTEDVVEELKKELEISMSSIIQIIKEL